METHILLTPKLTRDLSENGTAWLDLVRAIATNLVLLDHIQSIYGETPRWGALGELGVCLFFLLSGFLIFQSCWNRLRRPGRSNFGPFLVDRFARIYTPYIPVLLIIVALNYLYPLGHFVGEWGKGGISEGPVSLAANLLMLQDYPLFQAGHWLIGPIIPFVHSYNTAEPFWTVAVEFWIYVLFGLSFFGVCGERFRPLALVLGAVASPVVIWNGGAGGGHGLSLVWLLGALGAYVWVTVWHDSKLKGTIGAILTVAAAMCICGRGVKTGWVVYDTGLEMLIGMLMLGVLSTLEAIARLPAFLRSTCKFLASYSFSLYLVHNTTLIVLRDAFPSGSMTGMCIAFVTSHLVALGCYWLFERHYRHIGSWLKMQRLPAISVAREV